MNMNITGLAKYSAGNRERIKRVIRIILEDLELQGINRLTGNKIPLKRFENESLDYIEVIEILKAIQREYEHFKIANLEIKKMMEPPDYIFDQNHAEEIYKKEVLKRLNLSEDDLKNNLIIRADSLDITVKLKELSVEIDNISPEKSGLHENWGWFNKKNGEYQFGKLNFKQEGTLRKEVFIALMDTYESSPQAISIQTVCERSGIEKGRIRIEISAINGRLSKKVGYYFKGSGTGFYTLIVVPKVKQLVG
jgi:hypothetical protein